MSYVRWESAVADARGRRLGVFALANTLARTGRLTAEDHTWWRTNNDWFDAAYPDPATVVPDLFTGGPVVTCWFALSATHLLARVPGYLALLDRYDVVWVERRSADPGVVLYEDAVQIAVAGDAR